VYTSRDVARVAGVSQSTVSYVMTGKRPISDKTRRRVEAAIEQLTYQPNAGARALASQRTNIIGLVVPFGPAADTAALLPFIETLAASARKQDYDILLVTADEGPSALTRLAGRSLCDAIVLMEVEAADPRIPVAASLSVPVVLIGAPDDPAGLPCIDLDFRAAGQLAVEDFAAFEHDRVVVIGHAREAVERNISFVRRLQDGALAAAQERGLPCDVISPVEVSRAGAREAARRAVEAEGSRFGILVAAPGAVPLILQALAELGRTPGRDVSVIALCADATAELMHPPVTNISLEPSAVPERVLRTLMRLLDPGWLNAPGGVELIRPRLIRRETTMRAP